MMREPRRLVMSLVLLLLGVTGMAGSDRVGPRAP